MNRKLLGFSLVAVVAVSMMGISYAVPGWLNVVVGSGEVVEKNSKTTTLLLNTTSAVDRKKSELAGFGWLYDGALPLLGTDDDLVDAFGITIHDLDLDMDGKNDVVDSLQNKQGWHGHNFKFGTVQNNVLCVKEIVDAPTSGISFDEDTYVAKVNVRNSELLAPITDTAVAYEIVTEALCPITIPTADIGLPAPYSGGLPLAIDVQPNP